MFVEEGVEAIKFNKEQKKGYISLLVLWRKSDCRPVLKA
jgi:hypothetical protein